MEDRDARVAWFLAEILPHEAVLRNRLRRMAVPISDIEDVAAESLARAYGYDAWQSVDNGKSFLFHIARNLVFDTARRHTLVQFDLIAEMDDLALADEQPSPETVACDRQRLAIVRTALAALPPVYQELVRLLRFEENSIEAVAKQLGMSGSSVEKRLASALVLLKEAMAKRDRTASMAFAASRRSATAVARQPHLKTRRPRISSVRAAGE